MARVRVLPIPVESIAGIGSRLLVTFLFEGGILRTPLKEVAKGPIEMSESLLERNRRNLIEPHRLFLLFEQDQTLRCLLIVQTLTMLVVCVSALSQCPVVDVAATSEGLRQDALLFLAWIEAILVGFLLLHSLQDSIHAVNCQVVLNPSRPKGNGPSIPIAEARGFTGRIDNSTVCVYIQVFGRD